MVSSQAMLSAIELTNYRAHAHTTVPLTRFTLLVGDNASGKTAVLEALHVLGRAVEDHSESPDPRLSREFLRRQGAAGDTIVAVTGAGATVWRFSLVIPRLEEATERKRRFVYTYGEERREGRLRDLVGPAADPSFPARLLSPAPTLNRLDALRLAAPSASDDVVPRLSEDGYGLATVLKELKAVDDARFRRVEEAAREVVPSLEGINFRRVGIRLTRQRVMTLEGQRVVVPEEVGVIADELLLKFKDTEWLPAHAASEGTLLALGLLTRLHAAPTPRLLLIDDLDRALHPRAQTELVRTLRVALDAFPEAQIVATTHSPYLADHFEPDAVVVLGRPGEGAVVARPLSEHPDRRLREALTTGEFLTASGEGWFWP